MRLKTYILSFGDSKATGANHTFFKKPTLSLAVPNNTIIFSKKIFDELKKNKSFKPQYVILNLGANNFNKNGIFTKRDYAIRRLLDFSELFSFLKIPSTTGELCSGCTATKLGIFEIKPAANISL